MFLNVDPEQLPITGAQLTAANQVLESALSATAATAVPVPAGLDTVSFAATAALALHAVTFYSNAVEGAIQLQAGAIQLGPTGVNYRAADTAGGGSVAQHNAGFTY
ncbi:PE domain-containing protein [Nocardia uniformis]|uniref:PE domain-containing protein n=1 Tax=Nocardia uniformis TaxID=53432 RepID=A0A849C3G5_9NOCA|nr:PE domain-containing protein [Nocardia uniformis]NNH73234.1 PE domain-containing protein [Nocardia uniformis]